LATEYKPHFDFAVLFSVCPSKGSVLGLHPLRSVCGRIHIMAAKRVAVPEELDETVADQSCIYQMDDKTASPVGQTTSAQPSCPRPALLHLRQKNAENCFPRTNSIMWAFTDSRVVLWLCFRTIMGNGHKRHPPQSLNFPSRPPWQGPEMRDPKVVYSLLGQG
jgi:hypothetical protein